MILQCKSCPLRRLEVIEIPWQTDDVLFTQRNSADIKTSPGDEDTTYSCGLPLYLGKPKRTLFQCLWISILHMVTEVVIFGQVRFLAMAFDPSQMIWS